MLYDKIIGALLNVKKAIKEKLGDDGLNKRGARDYSSGPSGFDRVQYEINRIAEAIRHTTGGGGGGTVDQTARDMAAGKENSFGGFSPGDANKTLVRSFSFDLNNPPTYRNGSWLNMASFLSNAAQVTPITGTDNFKNWIVYQRPPNDPGGVKVGKFSTSATLNKPAIFDGYTSFYTILFHVEQYGSGRDVFQRGSGWVFATGGGKFGPWAFIDYDSNGYQVTYRQTSNDVDLLTDLQTADKTSIVAAINELKARIDALGNP